MKLPLQDEMLELEGRQLECLINIIERQEQNQKRLENLILGSTSITWALVVITTIVSLLG